MVDGTSAWLRSLNHAEELPNQASSMKVNRYSWKSHFITLEELQHHFVKSLTKLCRSVTVRNNSFESTEFWFSMMSLMKHCRRVDLNFFRVEFNIFIFNEYKESPFITGTAALATNSLIN